MAKLHVISCYNYLDVVADIAGIVYDGEGRLSQLQLGGVVVGVGLVLTLKLLEEGVVIGIGEAGCGDRNGSKGTESWFGYC